MTQMKTISILSSTTYMHAHPSIQTVNSILVHYFLCCSLTMLLSIYCFPSRHPQNISLQQNRHIQQQGFIILTAKIKQQYQHKSYNIRNKQQINMTINYELLDHEGLRKYLQQLERDISEEQNIFELILNVLNQKDENMRAMEVQLTKLKAEACKNSKVISQLQQKIMQMCPNSNNTGSSFMMASQFKDYFEDFMKNCLPTCLSSLLPYPQVYAEYSQTILSTVYQAINSQINNKLDAICKILSLESSPQNKNKLKISLLKILQQNWKKLLQIQQEQQESKFSKYIHQMQKYENKQIIQIVQSEEYAQLDHKLIQICSYMLLQQRKWQFVLPANCKIQRYTKKDFNCIDGWIKEKENVIFILQGLARQNQQGNMVRHPNLKNYVIPYTQENDQKYKLISKQILVQVQSGHKAEKQKVNQSQIEKVDQYSQYSPKGITLPLSTKLLKLRQQQINEQTRISKVQHQNIAKLKSDASYNSLKLNKNTKKGKKQDKLEQLQENPIQKIETAIRKLSNGQAKISQNAIETDSVSILFSPNIFKGVKNSHQSSNHTLRLHNVQHVDGNHTNHVTANPSMSLAKSSKMKNNKNQNTKVNHNLISDPSFEDIIPLPQRKRDTIDLPLKRQSSKTKKSNSRKVSAGKIVGQGIQSKQNNINKNNKETILKQKQNKENINKQAMYKDMIRQKLGGDHKTQRTKQSRHKQKQEDRPLRIMHIKKIREKYLNL